MKSLGPRLLVGLAVTVAAAMTIVAGAPAASAQECACREAFVGDAIAAADGVFIGTITELDYGHDDVVTTANPPERTTYEIDTWIKGSPDISTIDVHRGDCDGWTMVGDEVAVAFDVDGDGQAVHTCLMPPASVVQAYAQPEATGVGPAVYLATSPFAPPLLLDANAQVVASDPDTDNRRIEAAAGCGDGTVAYLQDREVVIVDADFTEVESLQFRRVTDELFCPEPGVVLAIAGPAQERQVYDVRSREPITSQLTFGSPADAVGDLVAGAMEPPGAANATVRVVSRTSGVERTLIDPALLVDERPVAVASVRLSPTADRVAFTVTRGPEDTQQATVMIADTAGGSILALAEIGNRRAHVRWLSSDRLLVQTTTGSSTVHDAATLAVERELDARWVQHLDGDVLSGLGDSHRGTPGVGTALTRLTLPDGAPTVAGELPFQVQAFRLPVETRSAATGTAFVEAPGVPLPSEPLDSLVPVIEGRRLRFVSAEELPTPTPTATDDDTTEAASAAPPISAVDGEDAGILRWAVIAGAVGLGGVLLVLARRPQPHR
ncbi:MAG: hypothetical protein AAF480_13770 [Actinomycetota bacterium]